MGRVEAQAALAVLSEPDRAFVEAAADYLAYRVGAYRGSGSDALTDALSMLCAGATARARVRRGGRP